MRAALSAVLLAAACAGASPDPVDPTDLPDAEGEGGDAVVVVPFVVDMVALVPQGADLAILARVDLVRGSRVAPLVQEVLSSEGEFRALAASGIDLLQDVDRLLVAGREAGNSPDVVAFEHRWTEQRLLEVYAFASEAPPSEQSPAQIQEAGRFRVATRPGARMSLLILSPTVAAMAPPEMVPTILERAQAPGTDAGDTGRRLRMLDASAPDLAPAGALRVSATSTGNGWGSEAGQFGLPAPQWITAILALDDGASAFAAAGYASPVDAQSAEQGVRALLTQTFNPATMLLRLMGLSRALAASQVAAEGNEVTFRTHLAPDELDRVIERMRSGGP